MIRHNGVTFCLPHHHLTEGEMEEGDDMVLRC